MVKSCSPSRVGEQLLPGRVGGVQQVPDWPGDLPAQPLHQRLHLHPSLPSPRSVGTGLGTDWSISAQRLQHLALLCYKDTAQGSQSHACKGHIWSYTESLWHKYGHPWTKRIYLSQSLSVMVSLTWVWWWLPHQQSLSTTASLARLCRLGGLRACLARLASHCSILCWTVVNWNSRSRTSPCSSSLPTTGMLHKSVLRDPQQMREHLL